MVTDSAAPGGVVPVDARTFTACMEQLQEGYVASIAATAGCVVNRIDRDLHGLDLQLIYQRGVEEERIIQVQLKNTTTIKPDVSRDHFSYQFKSREHLAKLTRPRSFNKAILLVMVTNPSQALWTSGDHEALTTSHCCYWANLEGAKVSEHVASPTVHIPIANRFDAPALLGMFERLDAGGAI